MLERPEFEADTLDIVVAHTISQRIRSLKRIPPELLPLGT